MDIVEPRPTSTVVVIRRSATTPVEVLLVRRSDTVAFMAGAFVFPGGRLDNEDRAHAAAAGRSETEESRFVDLTYREELSFRVAAIRELAEEANVSVSIDDLIPFAHWVTPESERRRYDTRFFITMMPADQEARHDASEATALAWLTPADTIERARAGEIMLPPPTWTTLKELRQFGSIDAALAWARGHPIVRIQPVLIEYGEHKILTLPGDPLHPSMPAAQIPEDTRFVFHSRRGWLPASE